MTDFEESINREMTWEKYRDIREHVYGDGENTYEYTYGDVASWITWNRDGNGQIIKARPPAPEYTKPPGTKYDGPISIWEQNNKPAFASRITTDIVFVGLNMSGDGRPFKDSKGNEWPPFQNARGHRRIYKTFFGTKAEGGYFTDIIKPDKRFLNKIGKPANSSEVMRIVSNRPDILKEHIRLFKKELDFIGANNPLLIVFGDGAKWILDQGKDILREKKIRAVKVIWHYSYVNPGGDEGYKNDTREKLKRYITIP